MGIKVLHILNHSFPKTDGYAVRSSSIVTFQRQIGLDPVVLTSPAHTASASNAETIDGIRYYRTSNIRLPSAPFVHQYCAINRMSKRIDEVVKQERPDILHAHSPALWGAAAARVAKRHSLPFVYEMRGLWEDAAVDQGKTSIGSVRYRLSRALESRVARSAAAVVTIANLLKNDLAQRGIDESKIVVVNNGVDRQQFFPRAPDGDLKSTLSLNGEPTIGYLGTLYPWEGVDDLVRAVPIIRRAVPDFRVLIVGDGQQHDLLRKLVDQLDLARFVTLLGSVPYPDIPRYYSLMDMLVYPRRSSRNTEMVTPLKPLEAMAMQKAVIGSNVGGIRELLTPGTGVLFEAGNPMDLAHKCVELMKCSNRRQSLVGNAERDVVAARDWQILVKTYKRIYSNVLGS